jgi:hypothetical protein
MRKSGVHMLQRCLQLQRQSCLLVGCCLGCSRPAAVAAAATGNLLLLLMPLLEEAKSIPAHGARLAILQVPHKKMRRWRYL